MHRTQDTFIDVLQKFVPLADKMVLEIGCGTGYYSEQIARRCRYLMGIDPDSQKLEIAGCLDIPNAQFLPRSAQSTGFSKGQFDAAIFTLSLHHVPVTLMRQALDEAVRVTNPAGRIVVLEPTTKGSFFDAEIQFGAYDGDERPAKAAAQKALASHPKLQELVGLRGETVFKLDDLEDFMRSMAPREYGRRFKNVDLIPAFLQTHNYTLKAMRSLVVYKIRA